MKTPTPEIFAALSRMINIPDVIHPSDYSDQKLYRRTLNTFNKRRNRAYKSLERAKLYPFNPSVMEDALYANGILWDGRELHTSDYCKKLAASRTLDEYTDTVRESSKGPKFDSIDAIKQASLDSGADWFSKENMAHSRTSVYPRLFPSDGSILFVSSELDYEGFRLYSIRRFDIKTARITTVGKYQAFETKQDAYKAAEQVAQTELHSEKVGA